MTDTDYSQANSRWRDAQAAQDRIEALERQLDENAFVKGEWEAAVAEARNAALEEAAKKISEYTYPLDPDAAAAFIRALKTEQP